MDKVTAKWDWRAGLVALGFMALGLLGAIFLKDPAGRAACVGLVIAGASAAPSWLLHRSTGGDE